MGFVKGHPATKFIFIALLYSCVCLESNPLQRDLLKVEAYQVSGPSTTAVTQGF